MGRWSNLNRRDFLGRTLGAVASFYVLPPGAALATLFGAQQLRRIRLKAAGTKMAKANPFGTASSTQLAK